MRDLTVYNKYFYYLRKFGTFKKIKNILLNRREARQKKTNLKSLPYKVTIDPGNICNLACPCCQTGFKHPEMPKAKMLRTDLFIKALDQVKDHTLSVALYNFGEPFLNKNLFEMITYATANKVGTTIHSNFNLFNEQKAIDAVKSGLTHIYLSIDGATQEVYEQYRVKGNLDTVLENLELMVKVKRRMQSKYPLITWKFLIFDHNEHEVEMAFEKAKEIGVDSVEAHRGSPIPFDIVDEANYLNQHPALLDEYAEGQCMSLWNSAYISSSGDVFPCSLAFREAEVFGNLNESTFEEIWNNEKYTNARRMFSEPMAKGAIPRPCSTCKFCLKLQPDNFTPMKGYKKDEEAEELSVIS